MDSATIKLYKDGDDIIVVFKNASGDILDTVQKILEIQMMPTIIPDLEPPPECPDEHLDLSTAECLLPLNEVKTFSEFIDLTAKMMFNQIEEDARNACKIYYDGHNKIMADVISTLDIKRVKGFLVNCYKLSPELIMAYAESQYSTINDYVDSLPEQELRNLSQAIGNNVVSFFEF